MSATSAQIEALLDFLAQHPDLARGRIRNLEARVQSQRLWNDITANLNSMGGCTKTTKQWQKVWFDRKHLTKKAVGATRRSAAATGGGPSTAPPLTATELKILSIMGDGFGEPQTSASVPAFPEQSQPSLPAELENSEEPVDRETEDLVENTPASQSQSQASYRQSRRSSIRRINRSAQVTDVRRRMFILEEQRLELERERNRELVGIKTVIEELCKLIAEIIHQNGSVLL